MSTLHNLRGCGTALVTPFTDSGEVDYKAVTRLVEFQISKGIDFLVPCGTTGEVATLSTEEHLKVVETVVSAANGRVPVIAGAGGYNTAKVAETARQIAGLGADGILSVTPYYNKPTQEGLVQHYLSIADSIDLPIILYNVPGRTQCNMLPDTVVRLSGHVNIIGIKEASGNIGQIGELAVKKPADFLLLSGDDPNTLPMIALGGVGVISVVSNQAPEDVIKLTHLCLENKFKEALTVQARLFNLMRLDFIETNPIPVKAGLAMMGFMEEIYRLPLVPMSAENREKLRRELKNLGLIT